MITLTAKINLLGGDNTALDYSTGNLFGNNISSTVSDIVGVKKNSINPFIIGASAKNDGSTLESKKVEYFIGNELSDEEGNFSNTYGIVIKDKSSLLTTLSFSFDTTNNRHPKSIIVDGVEYTDDDPIFTITNITPQYTHSIIIKNWNKPFYPIVITGIYSELSIEIDRRNLISLERNIFDRSNLELPSWGIISNTGNIEFNDYNGDVKDYVEQLLLQSGLSCEIRLNNTLIEEASETIGLYETEKWDYDNDNKIVSVSLKDDLEKWQEILVSKSPLQTPKTALELVKELQKITPSKWEFVKLKQNTEEVLSKIICVYPYYNEGSLWHKWNILCEMCGLYIYKNNEGKVVIDFEFEV